MGTFSSYQICDETILDLFLRKNDVESARSPHTFVFDELPTPPVPEGNGQHPRQNLKH
jgi:hypothetical protein